MSDRPGSVNFVNARLVLPESVTEGDLIVRHGLIESAGPGPAEGSAEIVDLAGDYLMPGVVDLHTDNLERQVEPRSSTRWPSRSAMLAHDGQCAMAGITTVLDSLCVGDLGFDENRMQTTRAGVADLDALAGAGTLRCDHYLHLRCELPAHDLLPMLEPLASHPLLRMVSLMDHSPGVGQYANLDHYRALRRRSGTPEPVIERRIADIVAQRDRLREPNRRAVLARFAGSGIALASHDDRTEGEIAENAGDGVQLSEFPVTLAAAREAQALGMKVIAGAPNLVRGGSHSGNVSVSDLLAAGVVDLLASDYVPSAMIEAAFIAARLGMALPEAVAMITDRPAQAVGFADRGRLKPGLRADLVRVRLHEGMPLIRAVWRQGVRIA